MGPYTKYVCVHVSMIGVKLDRVQMGVNMKSLV